MAMKPRSLANTSTSFDRGTATRNLELSRQIGPAVDRFDNLLLAAGDALAIEPDLTIGAGVRRQMIGDCARQFESRGVGA